MRRKQATPEQIAAAKAKREKFMAIVKKVAEMPEADRIELATRAGGITTCEGHALSVKNSCLAISQFPAVSIVGGFQQWRRQGRSVAKGQHGFTIWAKAAAKSDASEEEIRFLTVTVFDISQTVELGAEIEEGVAVA